MPEPLIIHAVPHTHWDREWYEPFEGYRFQLVKVVDQLLDVLEDHEDFRHFNFDGQTAAVEDYLEIRPGVEPDIARQVAAGRLAVGPWRILMDEFLCSPETIVRNLQQGAATAGRLGRSMKLGYIPDSFGHIAQMPQILTLAGLDTACVWRGVPRAVDRTAFTWEAPDGSRVRALYLATSYSNAASLPETIEELMVRARRIALDLEPFVPGGVLLGMNGSDHRAPQDHLPTLFAKANAGQDEFTFRIGSMEEYAAAAPSGIDTLWRGEMRSGARANLLMGVVSARTPLKQLEFAASAALERYAEPLAALAGTDTGRLLERAWRGMVENSAHDSICGCGIDIVADQVAERYREAIRVADLIANDALETLAARVDSAFLASGVEGIIAFNPSPRARDGVVELTMTAPAGATELFVRAPDGSVHPVQILSADDQVIVDMKLKGSQLARLTPTIHSRLLGTHYVNEVTIEPKGRHTVVRLGLGTAAEGAFDVEAAKRTVEDAIARKPHGTFHVLGMGPRLARALVRTPVIDAVGWTVLEPVTPPARGDGSATDHAARSATDHAARAARASGTVLDNGLVRAEVDAEGTVTLTDLTTGNHYGGLLGIEDGGDAGDEYNYSPPENDIVVREPSEPATIEVIENGPVRATIRVTRRYRIPAGLSGDERARSRRAVTLPVVTDLMLHAGDPFLRATIDVRNEATDHRLRLLVPLGFTTDSSAADTAFHVTERSLIAEGGDHEAGLATYPCRRWVSATDGTRGLAVFHRGTPEYEVVDGSALAMTLVRSVGWLSRQELAMRAGPAGPALAAPGAQLPGTHRFELAIAPHAGDWKTARVHAIAERFTYPMRGTTLRAHPGALPPHGGALDIEPACVQLSALVRDPGGIVARVYNASPEAVNARLAFGAPLEAARAIVVGLLGDERAPVSMHDGIAIVKLRPWEIVTVRLPG